LTDRPLDDETLARAVAGALRILERWRFAATDAAAVLGAPSAEVAAAWAGGRLEAASQETILRVGAVVAIDEALSNLPERDDALRWLDMRNVHLKGRTPRKALLRADLQDLADVNGAAQSVMNW
jgi:hypothetical protein